MIDRACISLTEQCNLRCRYCHFRDKQNDGGAFTEEEALAVIENIWRYIQTKGIRSFKLGIVGAGEPLLELDTMVAMLELIESYKTDAFRLYTITNGTLASEDALEKLLPYVTYDLPKTLRIFEETRDNAQNSGYDLRPEIYDLPK